jgi:hypothetical protein
VFGSNWSQHVSRFQIFGHPGIIIIGAQGTPVGSGRMVGFSRSSWCAYRPVSRAGLGVDFQQDTAAAFVAGIVIDSWVIGRFICQHVRQTESGTRSHT